MTQRVWRIVEYNLFVAMLLYLMDSYCTTHATISPLCHFRANAYGVPSNPEGAPAGGISALVYGLIAERIPLSTGCEAARCNNSPPPKPTKTSPESTRPEQSESNLRSAQAGALGGSSGRVREVWRVGRPLRKGVPSPSKVFLPLTSCHLHPRRRRTSRLQSACAQQASA